ncbi:MAG: ABC transporter ATP-binding protein, partial [Stellaceae bacterium]
LTTKELRLMELARALAGRPRLLLLDEPLAGLGGGEVEAFLSLIRELARDGITIVVIEHTMQAMVRLAERLLVLDHGRLIAAGPPGAVTRDERVIEAYLGRKWAALDARG